MEQREIDYIGEDLYQRTILDKKNGEWTENDIKLESELYKDLNSLDSRFNFYWHMQLSPLCFTAKDKGIVPIFKKYIGKFDNRGFTSICIDCLGVPKLYDATEICLEWYHKCKDEVNNPIFVSAVNAIYRIKDPHYIKEYLEILDDKEHRSLYVGLIAELLGKLKVKEAVPKIIALLESKERLMVTEAIIALGLYRDLENIQYVVKYLKSEDSYMKNQTAIAIKRMGGKVEKIKTSPKKYYYEYRG